MDQIRALAGIANAGKATPEKAKAGAVINAVSDNPMRRDRVPAEVITPIQSDTNIINHRPKNVTSHDQIDASVALATNNRVSADQTVNESMAQSSLPLSAKAISQKVGVAFGCVSAVEKVNQLLKS